MLTLYEYNALPDAEKTNQLWEDGVCLDRYRIEDDCKVMLYALYSFYVEIYYRHDANEIKKIRTFKNTSQLDPYLN